MKYETKIALMSAANRDIERCNNHIVTGRTKLKSDPGRIDFWTKDVAFWENELRVIQEAYDYLLKLPCEKEKVINKDTDKKYDQRHGGPFDRGSADSYYNRPRDPHYYVKDAGTSPMITNLTETELEAYNAGYDWNEQFGEKKDYR